MPLPCRPPTPPEGTHRYVLMLFAQPRGKRIQVGLTKTPCFAAAVAEQGWPLPVAPGLEATSPGLLQARDPTQGSRGGFNTRGFATAHGLGDPVGVSFFLSQR